MSRTRRMTRALTAAVLGALVLGGLGGCVVSGGWCPPAFEVHDHHYGHYHHHHGYCR